MPRHDPLTKKKVRDAKHDGTTPNAQRIYDGTGTGLALNIRPEGTKSWVQVYTIRGHGRRRWIGLGPYPLVSLDEARAMAWENKKLARKGIDPVARRNAVLKIPDFRTFAEQVIEEHVAK